MATSGTIVTGAAQELAVKRVHHDYGFTHTENKETDEEKKYRNHRNDFYQYPSY